MKRTAPDPFKRAAGARPAARNGQVALVKLSDQRRDLGGVDLEIGGQGEDHLTLGLLKAGHDRGRLAEAAGEADDGDAVRAGVELAKPGGEFFTGSVKHEDRLVTLSKCIESGAVLLIEFARVR